MADGLTVVVGRLEAEPYSGRLVDHMQSFTASEAFSTRIKIHDLVNFWEIRAGLTKSIIPPLKSTLRTTYQSLHYVFDVFLGSVRDHWSWFQKGSQLGGGGGLRPNGVVLKFC